MSVLIVAKCSASTQSRKLTLDKPHNGLIQSWLSKEITKGMPVILKYQLDHLQVNITCPKCAFFLKKMYIIICISKHQGWAKVVSAVSISGYWLLDQKGQLLSYLYTPYRWNKLLVLLSSSKYGCLSYCDIIVLPHTGTKGLARKIWKVTAPATCQGNALFLQKFSVIIVCSFYLIEKIFIHLKSSTNLFLRKRQRM